VSAKLEREAQKLYLPISAYSVRLTRTSTGGEREQFMSPLGTRMADYAEHIEQQKKEIEKLRKEWEIIVGEIWKFGVGVLGEETMEELLFTNNGNELMSSLSKDTDAESSLFVAEQGTSPPVRKTRAKKRVTFEAPEDEAESPRRHGEHLAFLYGPSLLRVKPAPDVPTLSEQDIDTIEEQVKQLGKKELEEYRKAEKEYEQYWRKKMAQVTNALRD
jgi:flagellar biosynthesis chaperone FliJ